MTTTSSELDLAELDRRYRGRDRPPRPATAIPRPTACTRWSATTSRSTARAPREASGCARCSGCSPTPASPASTSGRCPAPPPSSSATTSRLVHDDIEDGDVERRHRPTLWTIHGVPQAINTGDTLFSLSRIALHRLTDLGFPDRTVLRLMRLYDETCLALCEGQYLDIAMSASDDLMSVELYFDMIGRKTAALIAASIEAGAVLATERRGGHRPLSRIRLGARAGIPAQRRPARHLGTGTGDRQGTVRCRASQEDPARHLRLGARRSRGPRAAGRALCASTGRRPTRSPR